MFEGLPTRATARAPRRAAGRAGGPPVFSRWHNGARVGVAEPLSEPDEVSVPPAHEEVCVCESWERGGGVELVVDKG
eukprot:scaffold182874_cov27-Tisochrysis_lutea.AAC.1